MKAERDLVNEAQLEIDEDLNLKRRGRPPKKARGRMGGRKKS